MQIDVCVCVHVRLHVFSEIQQDKKIENRHLSNCLETSHLVPHVASTDNYCRTLHFSREVPGANTGIWSAPKVEPFPS